MTKRSIFIWVLIIVFGLASMPVVGFAALNKQTGNTEVLKKKPKKKSSKKTKKVKKNKKVLKKKKGSKKLRTTGKKNNKKKHSKKSGKKKSGKKKYSKKRGSKKRSYKRKHYAPPTNSNKVEYKNYKRNNDGENSGSEQNIEKIAPSKEIKKEPKKEGE